MCAVLSWTVLAIVQETVSEGDVVGGVWLGLMIIFFVAVFVTGFTAKKIENISQPGYGKALIAQMLIGPLSLGGLMMFGLYLDAPPILAFAIAYSFIPIVIYKIVFPCMWREAALIWIVVLLVLSALTYVLLLVGWISLSSIIGG
jgi:hypothetical protein